jgi:hypothetical protein
MKNAKNAKNVKNAKNAKNTKNTKTANGVISSRTIAKKPPKGSAGGSAAEVLKKGTPRVRKVSKVVKKAEAETKKTKTKKTKAGAVPFGIFEVTLPDGRNVQRRFKEGKNVLGALMVRLVADERWYVLLWTSKDDLDKRAEKITARWADESSEKFQEKLYHEVRITREVRLVGEQDVKAKVASEDRTVLNRIRKGLPKPTEVTEPVDTEEGEARFISAEELNGGAGGNSKKSSKKKKTSKISKATKATKAAKAAPKAKKASKRKGVTPVA